MRFSDVQCIWKLTGTKQKCAGLGYGLPSALNNVWRLSRYAGFVVLPSLALQVQSPRGVALWSLAPLCFSFLGFLCVKVAICANSLHCLCNPCRPQPLLAPWHEMRLCQNPIQTRAGNYIHALYIAYTLIYSTVYTRR